MREPNIVPTLFINCTKKPLQHDITDEKEYEPLCNVFS